VVLPSRRSPSTSARRLVEEVLPEVVGPLAVDIVVLVTSEAVTNTAVYAGTFGVVLVRDLDGYVEMEVVDSGKQIPVVDDGVLACELGASRPWWRPTRRLGRYPDGRRHDRLVSRPGATAPRVVGTGSKIQCEA
jgi:hypothetical protein